MASEPEALMPIFEAGQACRAVQIRGLMLLPPAVADPERARPVFCRAQGPP